MAVNGNSLQSPFIWVLCVEHTMAMGYFNDRYNNMSVIKSVECVYFMSISSIACIIVLNLYIRCSNECHTIIRSREYAEHNLLEMAF